MEWGPGLNIVVVMPAYNAAATGEQTVADIDRSQVSEIILVDDASSDNTVEVARGLGLRVIEHDRNKGYGGNQKTCYRAALETDADVIVMVHPDYQYDSRVIGVMAQIIDFGICDIVLGNRMRARREALDGASKRLIVPRVLLALARPVVGRLGMVLPRRRHRILVLAHLRLE